MEERHGGEAWRRLETPGQVRKRKQPASSQPASQPASCWLLSLDDAENVGVNVNRIRSFEASHVDNVFYLCLSCHHDIASKKR